MAARNSAPRTGAGSTKLVRPWYVATGCTMVGLMIFMHGATVPECRAGGGGGFTEVAEFGDTPNISLAWGDYDNDGDPDLALANVSGANLLYTQNPDHSFTESNQFGAGTTFVVLWADYDNDGDLDMAIGDNGGQNELYVNTGSGFVGEPQFGAGLTTAMAWADCDNDGDLDLAVGNGILHTDQQNFIYINNGDLSFTGRPEFGAHQTGSLVWGDYDGDGDPDLAVGNGGFGENQQNYLYVNNGDCTFEEQVQFGAEDTASIAWADTDNDGDLDLGVGNWNEETNTNYLYVNNGNRTFTQLTPFDARNSRDTNTITWGDFNNDGWVDNAAGNGDFQSADENDLFVNVGGGLNEFVRLAEFGLGSTDGLAWADYDGDGDLDVAAANEHSSAQNYLYVNTIDDGASISLGLVGHRHDLGSGFSNRDGIGAKVYAYEAGFMDDPDHLLGMREISAHGGFTCQNSMEAFFGVPSAATVDVTIVWPGSDGFRVTQSLPGLSVGQRHVIHEQGVPEEIGCLLAEAATAEPGYVGKSRYLSFVPATFAEVKALRVTLVDLDGYAASNGEARWVGPAGEFPEEDSSDPERTFTGAGLQCEPHFADWSSIDVLYVFGAEIMPGSQYQVDAVHFECADRIEYSESYADPIELQTGKWGDAAPLFEGDDPGAPQPDFIDISSLVAKFTQSPSAPIKAHAQLLPNVVFPDRAIDFKDISAGVDAFVGTPFAEALGISGPCTCPPVVTCGTTPCANDSPCGGGLCVGGFCADACGRCTP